MGNEGSRDGGGERNEHRRSDYDRCMDPAKDKYNKDMANAKTDQDKRDAWADLQISGGYCKNESREKEYEPKESARDRNC
jgi:hypothetical protein